MQDNLTVVTKRSENVANTLRVNRLQREEVIDIGADIGKAGKADFDPGEVVIGIQQRHCARSDDHWAGKVVAPSITMGIAAASSVARL